MKEGDIVFIHYTGKEEQTGKVFDTTDEAVAKEAGLWAEGQVHRHIPVVVGKGQVLKGLDEKLKEMKAGEEKTFSLEAKDAFGERRKELVRVVPLQEFRKRKIQPFAGLIVDVDGNYAKVQAVSGGRVRLDFNPELAGRRVTYTLKIEKELTEVGEQVQALAEKFFPLRAGGVEAKVSGKTVEVKLPAGLPKEAQITKQALAKALQEYVKGVDDVKFVETFGKKEAGKDSKEGR